MDISVILSIIGLIVLWASSLITLWVRLNVKIAEIYTKSDDRYNEFKEHVKNSEEIQKRNEAKFDRQQEKMEGNHKELICRIDLLIEKLNNLAIYVEKQNKIK